MANIRLRCNNTSGIEGVCYDVHNKRWVAVMRYKNVKYNLGRYLDKEEAIEARLNAEARAKIGLPPKDTEPRKNKKRSGRNKMIVGPQPEIRRFPPGDSGTPVMLKDWLERNFGDVVKLHQGMRNRVIVNGKTVSMRGFIEHVDQRRREKGLPPILAPGSSADEKENGNG